MIVCAAARHARCTRSVALHARQHALAAVRRRAVSSAPQPVSRASFVRWTCALSACLLGDFSIWRAHKLSQECAHWPFAEGTVDSVELDDWLTLPTAGGLTALMTVKREPWYRVEYSYRLAGKSYSSTRFQFGPLPAALSWTQRPHFSGYAINVLVNPSDHRQCALRPGMPTAAHAQALVAGLPLLTLGALVRLYVLLLRVYK